MSDDEIDHLTLKKYDWRMRAHQLKRVDVEHDIHLQSWTNQQVQATKGKGTNVKSKFNKFEDFFNKDKMIKKVEGKTPTQVSKKNRIAEMARRANQGA